MKKIIAIFILYPFIMQASLDTDLNTLKNKLTHLHNSLLELPVIQAASQVRAIYSQLNKTITDALKASPPQIIPFNYFTNALDKVIEITQHLTPEQRKALIKQIEPDAKRYESLFNKAKSRGIIKEKLEKELLPTNEQLKEILTNDNNDIQRTQLEITDFEKKLKQFLKWALWYSNNPQEIASKQPKKFRQLAELIPTMARIPQQFTQIINELNDFKDTADLQDTIAILHFLNKIKATVEHLMDIIDNGWKNYQPILQKRNWGYLQEVKRGDQHYQLLISLKNTLNDILFSSKPAAPYETNILNKAIQEWTQKLGD